MIFVKITSLLILSLFVFYGGTCDKKPSTPPNPPSTDNQDTPAGGGKTHSKPPKTSNPGGNTSQSNETNQETINLSAEEKKNFNDYFAGFSVISANLQQYHIKDKQHGIKIETTKDYKIIVRINNKEGSYTFNSDKNEHTKEIFDLNQPLNMEIRDIVLGGNTFKYYVYAYKSGKLKEIIASEYVRIAFLDFATFPDSLTTYANLVNFLLLKGTDIGDFNQDINYAVDKESGSAVHFNSYENNTDREKLANEYYQKIKSTISNKGDEGYPITIIDRDVIKIEQQAKYTIRNIENGFQFLKDGKLASDRINTYMGKYNPFNHPQYFNKNYFLFGSSEIDIKVRNIGSSTDYSSFSLELDMAFNPIKSPSGEAVKRALGIE